MAAWNPEANEIFRKAVGFPSADDRRAYLDEVCHGNDRLRGEIEALIADSEQAGGFLESPPPGMTAPVDSPQLSDHLGSLVGPYKLLEQIGEGGMGVVYMAEQQEPVRRKVAVKLIKPGMDTRQVFARFEAERKALAVMDHPNIARVLDAGAAPSGHPYFVMELVRGIPITTYCDENNLPVHERLELFASVCQAIQHAHTKGIIHGDVKPTNVLVTHQDDRPVVKIIDFGVAKAMGQQLTAKTLLTNFSQIGTLLYMSPEQLERGGVDVDTRSDIFSLGVLLYELLTGSKPVDERQLSGATFDEIRRIIREDSPPIPSARISGGDTLPAIAAHRHVEPARLCELVRGELDWIVMKALEKDRSRRYETANAFAADVLHYLNDEPVQACPPTEVYRVRNLAEAYRGMGRFDEAIENYHHAIRLAPGAAVSHLQLGTLYQQLGKLDRAIACYERAFELDPKRLDTLLKLGNALREQGRLDEAMERLQRAVAMNPGMWAALLDEALVSIERALALNPGRAELLFNKGSILKDLARVTEAIEWHDRAIAVRPDYDLARYSRATALLSLGRFEEGWAGYEHRVSCPTVDTLQFPQPFWDGSPLEDRRLLVHCEQGLGDSLQFVRYLPLVRKRAKNVTLAVRRSLVPLLEQSGYTPLVAKEDPLPAFDVHAPLMSLPHIFGTTLENVPAKVPYLSVEAARVDQWRAHLEAYPGFRVGIAWQGRPTFRSDHLRSIPLEQFAPLAEVEGVRLVSLQKGPGSEQVAALARRFELLDLGPRVDNRDGALLDTAAVMQSLDLVISSDTVIAHLAGALARPVWVALSFAPEWRWMYGRDDSPWYPTMRLFRQSQFGDWPELFRRIADALRAQV